MSLYLSAIEHNGRPRPRGVFPWSVRLVEKLERLEFDAPVTFLVGENGCGKSTVLEGLAAGMRAVAAGSRDLDADETLEGARAFASGFTFVRRQHTRNKLFLRAEDVFGFTRRVAEQMVELRQLEEEFGEELPEGWGRMRAMGMAAGQRRALAARYGADPDARSHGETFLHLLNERIVPRGLYVLDEPETPLSPARVLALLSLIKDRVEGGCQFIIATHSPILMALPGARILTFTDAGIHPTPYEEVEHVRLTRDFLANPQQFLRYL